MNNFLIQQINALPNLFLSNQEIMIINNIVKSLEFKNSILFTITLTNNTGPSNLGKNSTNNIINYLKKWAELAPLLTQWHQQVATSSINDSLPNDINLLQHLKNKLQLVFLIEREEKIGLTLAELYSALTLKMLSLEKQKKITDLQKACAEYKKNLQELMQQELSKDKLALLYYKNNFIEMIADEENRKEFLDADYILFKNAKFDGLMAKYKAIIDLQQTLSGEHLHHDVKEDNSQTLLEFANKYALYAQLLQSSHLFWKSKEQHCIDTFKSCLQQNTLHSP